MLRNEGHLIVTSQVFTAFSPSINLSAMGFGISLYNKSSLRFLSSASFFMFSSKAFPLSNSFQDKDKVFNTTMPC